MDVRLALIGLLVGLVVGFSGIGGSSFMTPLLILFLGVKPLVAIGTDLVYSVPTKLFGAFVHGRQGTVQKGVVLYLCLGGIPAAVIGVLTLGFVRARVNADMLNALAKHAVGVVLLVAAAAMVLPPLLARWRAGATSDRDVSTAPSDPPRGRLIALGAFVGVLVSWTSIGSGSITLPALGLLAPRIGLRLRVGSDIAFAALLIPVAAAAQLGMGNVDLPMSASLLVGSIPGVFVGSKLCKYVPDVWLRPTLAGVLLLAASRLM
jgi:uncharacterized membrane protein YfcA